MKIGKLSFFYILFLCAALTISIPIFSNKTSNAYGQAGGNSITGHIFGFERQPLENIEVELQDELGRSMSRTRTNGSGFYSFNRISSGRFRVRVMPFGTDYEEQEGDVEIVNFVRQRQEGGLTSIGGIQNEQLDFYLKLRKGITTTTGVIFFQQVPDDAKKLYEKAVKDLEDKKEKEGLEGLRLSIEKFPTYYLALSRLGTEYVQRGSLGKHYFEAAQILLSKAVEINSRSYRSWYGLAYALYSLNKSDEALAAVQKTLEIYPNWAEALLLNGVLLRQNKEFAGAEKQLLKAKEFSKGSTPDVHWHLALLYGNDLKRYREAANELKLFLKAQPDSKNAETIKKLIKEFEEKAAKS